MINTRTLLSASLIAGLVMPSSGQVAVSVLEPPSIQGGYANTWAQPGDGWGTPDMMLPANAVVDTLALAYDATAADSLCCAAVANPSEIAGKIAVLYRGTCNYSIKAKFCQDVGAVAVIIINNVPGAPATMGAGAVGADVTIPVFQVQQDDGALIRDVLDDGTTVVAFLGNKIGYFNDDIGFYKEDLLGPPSIAFPALLAGAAGEHEVQVGAWVANYGQEDRTDVTLHATVVHDGNTLYDETSDPFAIPHGDSLFIQLPTFSQDSYAGRYTLSYSAAFGGTDEDAVDNARTTEFSFDTLYSLVPIDYTLQRPITSQGIQPAPAVDNYQSCVHFQDDHASRVAVSGFHFYASLNEGSLLGEVLIPRIYEWQDDFTGLSDPNFAISTLVEIYNSEYTLPEDTNVYRGFITLTEPVALQDDMRYLFCLNTFNSLMFLGYNDNISYYTNDEVYDQPTSPNQAADQWYVGFIGGAQSSFTAHMVEANVGIEENGMGRVAPYPNPSTGIFQLPLEGHGRTEVVVSDVTGRVIHQTTVSTELYTLDLRGEARGVYQISLRSNRGFASGRLVLE